jgi:hypothetical protein
MRFPFIRFLLLLVILSLELVLETEQTFISKGRKLRLTHAENLNFIPDIKVIGLSMCLALIILGALSRQNPSFSNLFQGKGWVIDVAFLRSQKVCFHIIN